ncbi:Aste57867_16262 [Aphanomyces stellatus]|uniref:Aste57867_16262 protein n=1 Tax=Aphanomyces stellatus TaxID=120398 RepID=A0A485L634_9STRA|nr:hypothetical protein As57867_016205 [Aphanomyces stellatus]VFT93039.1 Aste57867_16262 [Aphanomyces stellatus]
MEAGCSYKALAGAARHGHLAIVEFLITQYRTVRDESSEVKLRAFSRQVRRHPEEYAHQSMATWTFSHGHFDVVKWLCQHASVVVFDFGGNAVSGQVIDGAARSGHFEMVRWLHEHTTAMDRTSAISDGASTGKLDILKWILDHYPGAVCATPWKARREMATWKCPVVACIETREMQR